MNTEDLNPFEKRKDESYSEFEIRKAKLKEEYTEKFKQQFREDPKIQAYIKNFQPNSIEKFLNSYVRKKVSAFQYGKFYENKLEQEDLKWINYAEKQLGNIQQKKLFNMQCLWRAEKISLPEIEIAYDFMVWEEHILDCPFIEPITMEDVELYQRFLQQENTELGIGFLDHWQNYEVYKYHRNSNVPEWYEYYDTYKGTSSLINLPDIRGEKEKVYLDTSGKELKKKHQENANKTPLDKRPYLDDHLYPPLMLEFIKRFEDKHTQKYLKIQDRIKEMHQNEEFLMNKIKILIQADMPFKFEEADDWKTSLSKTVEKIEKLKVIEFLPLAFEQYQLKASMGNNFNIKDKFGNENSIRNFLYKSILDGRELLGEPRNFDF